MKHDSSSEHGSDIASGVQDHNGSDGGLPAIWFVGLVVLGFSTGLLCGLSRDPVVGTLLPLLFGILAGGTGLYVTIGRYERRQAGLIAGTLLSIVPACLVGAITGGVARNGEGTCLAWFPGHIWCPSQPVLANAHDAGLLLSQIELRRVLSEGGASLAEVRALDDVLAEWPSEAQNKRIEDAAGRLTRSASDLARELEASVAASRAWVAAPHGTARPTEMMLGIASFSEQLHVAANLPEKRNYRILKIATELCDYLNNINQSTYFFADVDQETLKKKHLNVVLDAEDLCLNLQGTRASFIFEARRRLPAASSTNGTPGTYGVAGFDVSRDEEMRLNSVNEDDPPVPVPPDP